MRPGRELDCEIAQKVFGRKVFVKKHVLYEQTPEGDRPLRRYSKEMSDAWEVAEQMHMSLLPIENGEWFALVGEGKGWQSPADFMVYLQSGKFVNAGAAVAKEAPLAVCLAAMRALEARNKPAELKAVPGGEPTLQ